MLRRIPLYLFPIYLAVADYLVRSLLAHDSGQPTISPFNIIGPSIVAAGMVLIFPVLVPKPLAYRPTPLIQAELRQHNVVIYSVADQRVMQAAWIWLLMLVGVWVLTVYLAQQDPPVMWNVVPITMLIGGGAYLVNRTYGTEGRRLMDYVTLVVTGGVALLAILLSLLRIPAKRLMTRDVRIAFRTGEEVTLHIRQNTPEYQVTREIDAVVQRVLAGQSHPTTNAIQASAERAPIFEKHLSAPTQIIISSGHSGKSLPRHIEMSSFGKDMKVEYKRRMVSEYRSGIYRTLGRGGGVSKLARSSDWMKKHDEELLTVGEGS